MAARGGAQVVEEAGARRGHPVPGGPAPRARKAEGEGGDAGMRTALLMALVLRLSRQAALLRSLQFVVALEEWQGRVISQRL